MNPQLPPVPPDQTFRVIAARLATFHMTPVAEDLTGLTLQHEAGVTARDAMLETLALVERFAQGRSSLAKYDLLKWLNNKKQEIKLYVA